MLGSLNTSLIGKFTRAATLAGALAGAANTALADNAPAEPHIPDATYSIVQDAFAASAGKGAGVHDFKIQAGLDQRESANLAMRWAYRNAPEIVEKYYGTLMQQKMQFCAEKLFDCPMRMLENAHFLHVNYSQSDGLKNWNAKAGMKFIEQMYDNPAMVEASGNWNKKPGEEGFMDTAARISVMQVIADTYMASFAEGDFKPASPRVMADATLASSGKYFPDEHSFRVKLDEMGPDGRGFAGIADTTVHETRHGLQNILIKGRNDPVVRQVIEANNMQADVIAFHSQLANEKSEFYFPYHLPRLYLANPVEVDARIAGDLGAVVGQPAAREGQIAQLKAQRAQGL